MPTAHDIPGAVFKDGAATLLARVVNADGAPVVAADLTSVEYTVAEVDERRPGELTPVAGHQGRPLSVGQVVFDALQTDPVWTTDATGYNFRHDVDVSQDEAFPRAGALYQVRYQLTPVVGQKSVFRFLLRCL